MIQRDQIKSISKAIQLCDSILQHEEPVGLKELTESSGLNKTTTHRILRTMLTLDLITQDLNTKKYKLGPKLITLGLSALKNTDLHKEALPLMKKLRDETGETVNLSILDGDEIMTIERLRSAFLYSLNLSIGSRLPLHCTSQGKVILAFLNIKRCEEIINSLKLRLKTPKTIVDKSQFRRELADIRRTGYAINREEFEIGISAAAGPILDHTGEAVAAMNVSYAIVRHPDPEYPVQLSEKVVEACRQLSFSLGWTNEKTEYNTHSQIDL